MPHIIWFLRKIAEILWRWSQSRKPGGAGVNRKHIKICVNGENGFKYEDNTCQSVRLGNISNLKLWDLCEQIPPNHGPHLHEAKTRAIYNLPEIWEPKCFVFYTLHQAPSQFLHRSFLHVWARMVKSCGQMKGGQTADIPSPGSDLIPHPQPPPHVIKL